METEPNHTPKRTVLFVATVTAFLTPFMGSSVNVALPSIGAEFAADAIALSWVATAYLLAAAVFLLPFGRLADIHGRKRVFAYGIATYTVSSLLCAVAPSINTLIVFRILQGIGGAMIFGTGVAIVTSVYPAEERGKALGIIVAAVYTALSAGPFVGGILTQHFGWRSILAANVVMGIIPLALTLWKIKGDWAEAKGERFDLTGSVIYGFSLIVLMQGFSRLPEVIGFALTLMGAVSVAGFVAWELRVPAPLLHIDLFRKNRLFAFSNAAALINYGATFAVTFLMSLYLQYVKGLTPQEAGVILIAQPVMMALLSPFAGRLSDRIESRVVASIGMGVTVFALVLLIFLTRQSPLVYIIVSLMIIGVGFGLFSSPNTNAIMGSVEKRFYGVAAATSGTMRLTGQMMSMGLAMLILALFVGKVQITPAYHEAFMASMRVVLGISAGLCLVGVFFSLARGKLRN